MLTAVAGVGVVFPLALLQLGFSLLFRIPFQFTIRTLLLLVFAVAVPFGWLGFELRQARKQKAIVNAVKKHDGVVDYDWQWRVPTTTPEPQWLRDLLGADFFSDVIHVIDNRRNRCGLEPPARPGADPMAEVGLHRQHGVPYHGLGT